jgi:hypothetical protein
VTPEVMKLLNQLGSDDAHERDVAADYLSDLLDGPSLSPADDDSIGAALVRSAIQEGNVDARESQLHAMTYSFQLSFGTVEPLIHLMPSLGAEQLDHCLGILAATHDPAAEAAITNYAEHPDDRIRASVKEALIELRGQQ